MSGRPTTLALACVLGFVFGAWMWVLGLGAIAAMFALSGLGVVHLAEQERARAEWRIREALRRADIGIRKAALHMELDASDLERALHGERKLDLWRLEMLPDAFWQEYWPLLAEAKGVPAIFKTFVRITPAFERGV